MSRLSIHQFALVLVILVSTSAAARAQTVVYDWSSDSKVPESYPRITRRENVKFRITNVNDILFNYKLEITQTPISSDDFANLSGMLSRFSRSVTTTGAVPTCQALREEAELLTNQAITAINANPKLPVGYAKSSPHISVPLQDSINAWKSHLPAIDVALNAIRDYRQQCTGQIARELNVSFTEFETTVRDLDAKVNSSHVFEDNHVIDPGNDVTATVIERFKNETIKTKTFSFPGVDVLTLSAGALFSRIPDRTYEARKSPISSLNLLTVEGNSRATPSLVGLLNYSLGSIGLDYNNAGLALSAGPVMKLGNQSEASSFGFFTGISGHLYHRLYITPGIHFGQFADFPVGFNNGSTVPENFGEITPVKRWTARFGLAISFKAKDFSGLTASEPKVTGSEASGTPAQPAASPSPSPSPSPEASVLNLSNAPLSVAANFLRLPPRQRLGEVSSELPRPEATATRELPVRFSNAATPSRFVSSASTSSAAITHVTSIASTKISSDEERLFLNAAAPIREYAVYFRNGRFFLSLPRARLDLIQDGLTGEVFTDTAYEQRGEEMIISFALLPGTRARVEEQSNGLAVIFFAAGNN